MLTIPILLLKLFVRSTNVINVLGLSHWKYDGLKFPFQVNFERESDSCEV